MIFKTSHVFNRFVKDVKILKGQAIVMAEQEAIKFKRRGVDKRGRNKHTAPVFFIFDRNYLFSE